jgi:eukaryotic-like serine/threonine-protein kinase
MGAVYRARDAKLGRDVAIKVLRPEVANDPDRLARFDREARTLAALNHPHIAHIYGLENAQATEVGPFLVMELVEGPTLADVIAKGPIPRAEALPIAKQIAEALEAAHEQGIIHRDLKPANIKVRPDGVVKVLDFGLAKAMEAVGPMSPSASMSPTITSPAMTQAGMILGTAAYMSPEQARGRPIDKRVDIWAFGCVLFEMLTGKRAFEAEDVSLTLAEVMKSEPDWSAPPALPPAVRMCLRQCFKKDPRQRLRDIGEARLALEGALELDHAVEPSASPKLTRRAVWQLALPLAVASAIAAAAVTVWLQRSRPLPLPEIVRFEIHAPSGSKIPPGTPAISPDGHTLAYVVTSPDGTSRIHLRDIATTQSRALPGTEDAVHPFWSGNGRSLAFVSGRTLKHVDVAGGTARDLAQVSGPWHGTWNQFGDLLFISGGTLRVSAEGGTPVPAVQLNTQAGERASSFPAFLPDGRHFLVRVDRESRSAIHLASLDSRERKLVVDDVFSAPLVAPTPRGTTYILYARDDGLVAQEFNENTGEVPGTPRLIVSNIGRVANPAYMPTAGVSVAGTLAYQAGGDFTAAVLYWVGRTGDRLDSLELPGVSPTLSPDGKWVAASRQSARGDLEVWVTDLTRNVSSRLTQGTGVIRGAIWSPDNHRLAFGRSGKIFVKNADGSADEEALVDVAGVPTSWSANGKYLAYGTQGKMFLWPLTTKGSPIAVGSRSGSSRDAQVSPDGGFIAYVSNESGRDEIYVAPIPPGTGRVPISAAGGTNPRWSRSGRELFFLGPDRSVMAVDVVLGQTASAGIPRKLFQRGASFGSLDYDVTADGQRFLLSRARDDVPDTPITVVLNWWVDLLKRPN